MVSLKPARPAPAIEVANVSKRFFQQPVLSRVSFSVERGQSYVVLGQSGVGKSVLLKLLAGLLPPDEGQVKLATRNIGMLFQKNALFDSLSVFENLEFPLRERTSLSRAERKTKIEKYLDWVELPNTGHQFPDELSGGMQKRLGIARALIVEPEILFYDEPTAGLDPITSRTIAELMLRLKAELGSTIVVVTSDVMRAYQLGDQLGLLVKGPQGATLLAAGSPSEAKASQDPTIQQFMQGLTQGPLTHATDEQVVRDPSFACGLDLMERLDVDYF